jgi:DNA-binding response OmpR family regulator
VLRLGYEELFVALSEYGHGSPKDNGPLVHAKVLIVESEHHTRRTLRDLLLAFGCSRIHEARDVEGGLEAVQSLAPDLVLLDWQLPATGGADFVCRLRGAGFPGAGVPIIMLIGREQHSRVLEAVRLGVHEFLLKPISRGALEARLFSVLDRSRESPRPSASPAVPLRKLAS